MSTVLPDPVRLTAALDALGLRGLRGMLDLGASGPLRRTRLTFEGEQVDLMLTRCTWAPGYDPHQAALAAITALEHEELPVARGYRILPEGALDRPASLMPMPPGIAAETLVAREPRAMEPVLVQLGRILAITGELYQVRAGTRGDQGRFAPMRAGWRGEWRAFAESQLVGVRMAGLGELPSVRALWSALESDLAGLPESVAATLVHFGLRPASLWFTVESTGPQLSRVDEWEHAMAADPLAGWAPILTRLVGRPLRAVVDGFGAETADALDEDELSRIQLYVRTHALWQLQDAGLRSTHHPSDDATRAIEKSLALCEAVLDDRFAALRFEEARTGALGDPGRPRDDAARALERRTLLALGVGPAPPTDRSGHLLGALSAAELVRRTDGGTAGHFREVAGMFLDAAHLPHGRMQVLPVGDRASWRAALTGVASTETRTGGPAVGLALLAAALRVVDPAGDQVAPDALRGLEAMVLAQLARESAQRTGSSLSARQRLMHAILGQDAALALGLDPSHEAYRLQALDALDVLGVAPAPLGPGDPRPTMAELIPLLTRPIVFAGDAMLLLPVAVALSRLAEADALVHRPDGLVHACFAAQ